MRDPRDPLGEQVEIVVASGKGGVGKSTIAAVLAVELYRSGYRLVAADADAEAPNLHLALGVDKWDSVEPYYEGRVAFIRRDICTNCGICAEVCPFGAVEVRNGNYVINEWICEGCLTCSFACPVKAIRYRFKVKAGEIKVAGTRYGFTLVSGESMPGRPNSGKLVTEVKNRAKSLLGRSGVLLVDAAAGIGCQVISSLTGAHIAVLVAEPTPASFSDLKRIHKLTKHFMLAPMLVINKFDLNERFTKVIEEYAEENNIPVVAHIPYDENVPKALNMGRPLHEAFPGSSAAKGVLEVVSYIKKEVLPNWRRWWSTYKPKKPEIYVPIIK
ncbi:MAG: ATP-binding protein [Desulfurococcales archaeon]|nr:ATP-binding protein [Desulfurococcales archaeon]